MHFCLLGLQHNLLTLSTSQLLHEVSDFCVRVLHRMFIADLEVDLSLLCTLVLFVGLSLFLIFDKNFFHQFPGSTSTSYGVAKIVVDIGITPVNHDIIYIHT